MKVTITRIYYVLFILCILLEIRAFNIVNASMELTMALLFDVVLLFVLALWDKKINPGKWIYRYIVLVFAVIVIPQTIYAFYQGETIDGYIDVIRHIIFILLAVPLIKYFCRKRSIVELLDVITLLTTITLVLVLVNSFSLNNFGTQLIPFDYFQKPSTGRWGRIRLFLITDFTGFAYIYSFARLIKKESRNILYLTSLVVCLASEIYVEQARMLYMAMIATSIFMYAQALKGKKIGLYIAAGFMVIFGWMGDWFDSFFSMFSVNNAGVGISSLIRINEVKYAFELIKQHPVLGTGMVAQYLFPVTQDGFYFEYNHTDIGLLGTITYIGLLGASIIFIIPYIRGLRTVWQCSVKDKDSFEYYFLFGLWVYITITSLTVIITDSARIFVWPFVIAINEFLRKNWRLTNKCLQEKE